jgi:hypothetical protein
MFPIQKFPGFNSDTIQNQDETNLEGQKLLTTRPVAEGIAAAKDSYEVRQSDKIQMHIYMQEQAINTKAETNDSDSSPSETRRRKGLENIQKLLDILRAMNPQI